MKNCTILSIIFILSLAFSGCVQEAPGETPVPTLPPTPALTPTSTPTLTVPPPTPTLISTPPPPTPTPAPTPKEAPVTYVYWIDTYYGYEMIRAFKDGMYVLLPPDLDRFNITIDRGDRVRWVNDDSLEWPFTVMSNEELWTNRTGLLRWRYQRFEYTFNESGTYTFSIKEYPRLKNIKVTVK